MILPPHMLVRTDIDKNDPRITAQAYGSGGLSEKPDYQAKIPTVLDADALQDLPDKLSENYVLTPHQGEFDRAFPALKGDRQTQAQQAAKQRGCTIVLKGAETIIAASSGRVVINTHASPYLATAGSGDVLAGMITGLLAQNMPVFEACCAAVWIHGDIALSYGAGLVASDLPDRIPETLQNLFDKKI